MNKKQKAVLLVGLVIFGITLLAAPFDISPPTEIQSSVLGGYYSVPHPSYSMTAPIWDAPINGRLNVITLLVEWVGIGVVVGVLNLILRRRTAE